MDFNTIISIIGIIATLVFGILSIDLFKRKKYPGKITYVNIYFVNLLNSIANNFKDLQLFLKNQAINTNIIYIKGAFINNGDIEDADITKVAAFIKDMTGIGVLIPDDGLEDYVRQVGHLPERTVDTRDIDRTRQKQQEGNSPPEPETAAGKEGSEEGEEILEEQVEAAKKRLGRDKQCRSG